MDSEFLREAIQREIEKQMIRQEILAEELMRKRELEEEVRRELAFERDLAFLSGRGHGHGHLLQPRLPMLDRQNRFGAMVEWTPRSYERFDGFRLPQQPGFDLPEFVPRQVGVEVGASNRLPFQRYREAPKLVEIEAGASDRVRLYREAPKPAAIVAETDRPQAGKLEVLPKPLTGTPAGTKRKATAEVNTSGETRKRWKCSLCGVRNTCERDFKMHLDGKKHKENEANRAKGIENPTQKETQEVEMQTEVNTSGETRKEWKCGLCGVGATSENDFNMHLQGRKHKENEAACAKETQNPIRKSEEKNKVQTDSSQFWCQYCQVQCTGGKDFTRHCKGKRHQAKIERMKQTGGTGTASLSKENRMEKLKQTTDTASSGKTTTTGVEDPKLTGSAGSSSRTMPVLTVIKKISSEDKNEEKTEAE